jgi:hypothetical protein
MSLIREIAPSDMNDSIPMGEKVSGEPNGDKIDPRLNDRDEK